MVCSDASVQIQFERFEQVLEYVILSFAGARWNVFNTNTDVHDFDLYGRFIPLIQGDANVKKGSYKKSLPFMSSVNLVTYVPIG